MVLNPSAASGRLGRATRLVAIGALVVGTLAGCSVEEVLRFGWPEGITPQADRMRGLWVGSVVAALAVGFFVWGLIFWAVIRYRKRSDELPPQTRFNLPIEVLYTVIPFLIISVLFYYTAITQVYVTDQNAKPDVTVSVVAFKWNWQFVYPQEADTEGNPVRVAGTSDEVPILVVPTGKRIRFIETSNDVIHSFWVPELLFKRDVIPGRTNSFDVTSINRPGAYVGRCAELCGTYHSNMNFEMRVVGFDDYQTFIAEKKAGKSTADALRVIGQEPHATTTRPFNTERSARRPS